MKRILCILLLFSLLGIIGLSQRPIPSGPTLPTTCKVNDLFVRSTYGLYVCTATNVWTLQGPGAATVTGQVQAYNVVADGACVNTGLANMTTCINSAIVAANA